MCQRRQKQSRKVVFTLEIIIFAGPWTSVYPPPHMTHMYPPPHMTHMYPPPHMTHMYPPPHMTHMYPPPHMTHMYPPPHMTHRTLDERGPFSLLFSGVPFIFFIIFFLGPWTKGDVRIGEWRR